MARRSLKSRLLLLTATIVVSLLGAEGLFRLFGPSTGGFGDPAFYTPSGVRVPVAEITHFLLGGGYMAPSDLDPPYGRLTPSFNVKQAYDRPRWDYFDDEGRITIQHNSRGYRDDEFPIEKPSGEFRVLALGDSFTWGSGVLAQDTWPEVLERRLREGGAAQVVNCGFACGTFTPNGYDKWVQSDGLLLSPDLVIVGLCLNDMGNGNDVPMLSYQVKKPEAYPSKLLEYAFATYEWRQARSQVIDFAEIVKQKSETWNATQNGLRNLKRICDDAEVELVVAVFPMLSQLDSEPYPYAGLIAMARDFCKDAGIHCVDLGPEFIGRTDEMDLWVHPTDQHPNHIGHRIMGERVFAFLGEQKLLPQ